LGIFAPMAWNLAGFSRNSLISCSSSMASSTPATSANVVLGMSLLTSLALLRPKLITRFPPPCIWLRMKNRIPNRSRKGSIENSRDSHGLSLLTLVVKVLLPLTCDLISPKICWVASAG
jgi:hypothetical protein